MLTVSFFSEFQDIEMRGITNVNEKSSRITWYRNILSVNVIVFMSYTLEVNFVCFSWLFSMKASEIGEDPIKGDWVSNYIINDYFPPETVFSVGDDIVLSFEIADMLGYDYSVRCSSFHASNNTLTRCLWFHTWSWNGVDMSDNVGRINVTIEENGSGGGRSSLIEIKISNATENHVGLYDCTYHVRLTDWGEHPSFFAAITGTKLSLRRNTEWPTTIRYEMGNNLFGYAEIDDEAMMEERYPNVLKCIVTAWQFSGNISLYFQDDYLPVYGPIIAG